MKALRVVLYALMVAVLAGGWGFLFWQSAALDLAAGNQARAALNELRAIDARWNDQLRAGAVRDPARHGAAYAALEGRVLALGEPRLGLALSGLKHAFDEKAALMAKAAGGDAKLLEAAWLAPTGPREDVLARELELAFDAALGQAELYRAWLLYYSGFLLVVLGYLLWRLREANTGLERRVAERTRELSEALARLKESEAMLVQTEKMSSLGQMVAGLAHEVNTPLAYARASLEAVGGALPATERLAEGAERLLALLEADAPDEEELAARFAALRELIEELRGRGTLRQAGEQVRDGLEGMRRIGELVANLKDFSRLDRSKVAAYDLREGVASTLRIARHQLGGRKVRTVLGEVPPVPCAPSQINQVLLNLVVNAAQATSETDGVITIRTARRGDREVSVEVADNGHGIPEDVLPKIFDPFFTTKPVGKGTGLGLAISYRIAQDHGGRLEVQSRPGAGTRFTLVLPAPG